MPKVFNEQERERIREQLIEKGRELFSRQGLRGTSIRDLTRAVGIAQGTFYSFYRSKEELYFDILELEEQGRDAIVSEFIDSSLSTESAIQQLIKAALHFMSESPIIRRLYETDEYELLRRRLPKDRFERHVQKDTEALLEFIERWQKSGELVMSDPSVIAGLFRGIIVMSLHKEEIGRDVYPDVMALLANVIARGLTRRKEDENDNGSASAPDQQRC